MLVTNQTTQDIYFGPLHLEAGVGQQLEIDDTSATSLYLLSDSVADAVNNAQAAGRITVSGEAQPFPRPTGTPQLVHGDGSPEGLVYASQGSVYMRRDAGPTFVLYVKTTGVTSDTGWVAVDTTGASVPTGTITSFGGSSAPTGWLLCDGSAVSRTVYAALFAIIGTAYGVGDGSTTFGLPDLRGRVAVGFAASGGHSDVSTLGQNEGPIAAPYRRPRHATTNGLTLTRSANVALNDPGHSHSIQGTGSTGASNNATVDLTHFQNGAGSTLSAGSGITVSQQPNFTLGGSIGTNNANDAADTPSYLVVNHIIKI